MKSILNISLFTLAFITLQACGSFPQQTASHIHGEGNPVGPSHVEAVNTFDSQSEETSGLSFSQPEDVSVLDQTKAAGIGVILIPVSIMEGFTISDRNLRFCRSFFKSSCEHLRQQAGQQNRFPRAPVSFSDEPDK